MTERFRRLVLWFLAIVAALSLLLQKGHEISRERETVAFLPGMRLDGGGVIVRIEGDGVQSGIYRFDRNLSASTVIKMTASFLPAIRGRYGAFSNKLYSGDVLVFLPGSVKDVEIIRDSMSVSERMLFGVPLDPNEMSAAEWEKLPGIGPSRAKSIIEYRQNNGGFLSVMDLEGVSGVGSRTVLQLKDYFE